MATITPSSEHIAALIEADLQGPIQMVNLLKFKSAASAQSYHAYGQAVLPLLAEAGAKIIYQSDTPLTVIGEDAWDRMLIVEYPSKAAFLAMTSSSAYRAIAHLRHDALADSRLYCTQPVG